MKGRQGERRIGGTFEIVSWLKGIDVPSSGNILLCFSHSCKLYINVTYLTDL